MEIAERISNGVAVLEIKNPELNYSLCHEFQRQVTEILDRQSVHSLVVNLKNVVFLDSMGIGTLITLRNRLIKNGGAVVLCELTDQIKRVMDISSLNKVFDLYEAEAEALEAVEK
jgi:stage II sporulation protein AA (anti-sigma F factor antagonist)